MTNWSFELGLYLNNEDIWKISRINELYQLVKENQLEQQQQKGYPETDCSKTVEYQRKTRERMGSIKDRL